MQWAGRLRHIDRHEDGLNAWCIIDVAPPPALAGLILGYRFYDERTGGFTTRRELPHGEAVMIVNLGAPLRLRSGDGSSLTLEGGETFVAGPHLRPALSRSTGTQSGIHIVLPLSSLRRLLGVPLSALADRAVRLDDILPGWLPIGLAQLPGLAPLEQVALLDSLLIRRFAETTVLGRQQAYALRILQDRPDLDLAEIAATIGWSRKHLAARTRDAIGLGPRSYRRLLRFRRLTDLLSTDRHPDWAGLACTAGYFDQSHLIREFREFAGLLPGQFVARRLMEGGGLIEE